MTFLARPALARRGEEIAAAYFEQKGYRILARNYRCRLGEIDLVVEKGRTLVFVEVKARTSLRFGTPEESVGERKKRKLQQVAQCYLNEKGLSCEEIRLDVLSVLFKGDRFEISHFEAAVEF